MSTIARMAGYRYILSMDDDILVPLGFRNFIICQIRLEISRNFTEISAHLNRDGKIHDLMAAKFK